MIKNRLCYVTFLQAYWLSNLLIAIVFSQIISYEENPIFKQSSLTIRWFQQVAFAKSSIVLSKIYSEFHVQIKIYVWL